MAVVLVQSVLDQSPASGASVDLTFDFGVNITAGNTVIIAACVKSSGDISAVADATGAYTLVNSEAGWAHIFAKRNHAGGVTTITITRDSINNIGFSAYEVSGLDDVVSLSAPPSFTNTATTSHTSTDGGSAVTGNGFWICSAGFGAGTMALTAGASYTMDVTGTDALFQQHDIGSLASDLGPFSNSSALTSRAVMALFPAGSGVITLAPAAVIGAWAVPVVNLSGLTNVALPFIEITDLSERAPNAAGIHTAYHAAAAGSEAGAFSWAGAQDYAALTVAYKGTPATTQTLTLPFVP